MFGKWTILCNKMTKMRVVFSRALPIYTTQNILILTNALKVLYQKNVCIGWCLAMMCRIVLAGLCLNMCLGMLHQCFLSMLCLIKATHTSQKCHILVKLSVLEQGFRYCSNWYIHRLVFIGPMNIGIQHVAQCQCSIVHF